jgi:hypothetical protein
VGWLDTSVSDAPASRRRSPLRAGTKVEVRNRFDGAWVQGFEVAESDAEGYRVVRLSDGEVLPVRFDAEDVRRERSRQTWWV